MTSARTGLLALGGFQAADIATTLVGLHRGATEVGPLAAPALGSAGILGLILVPIPFVALQWAVLRRMPRQFRRIGWALVLSLACVPVLNNLAVIIR